jgi:hypothetical protein
MAKKKKTISMAPNTEQVDAEFKALLEKHSAKPQCGLLVFQGDDVDENGRRRWWIKAVGEPGTLQQMAAWAMAWAGAAQERGLAERLRNGGR